MALLAGRSFQCHGFERLQIIWNLVGWLRKALFVLSRKSLMFSIQSAFCINSYIEFKATWLEAREKCCSIGMTLATVQTMGKHNCMAKTALSKNMKTLNISTFKIKYYFFCHKHPDFASLGIVSDYWVYGTDTGSAGNFHWCSNVLEFQPKETKWAAGEPASKLSCVYLKNKGGNQSALATADCSTKKNYICDVRKLGTAGKSMQQECMETWGISIGI